MNVKKEPVPLWFNSSDRDWGGIPNPQFTIHYSPFTIRSCPLYPVRKSVLGVAEVFLMAQL